MAHYCMNCGNLCEDNQQFCPRCGAAQSQQPQYDQQPQYPQYQQQVQQETQTMPMKWFKFVIYFQLFASCVTNAFSGISALTGSQYQGVAATVYMVIPGLKITDMIYGIVLIALAVFAIVVRMRLSRYRVNGPKLYHIFLVAQMAISLLYVIGVNIAVADSGAGLYFEPDYTSTISSLLTTGIMLACNVKYFNKRKHLFTNP